MHIWSELIGREFALLAAVALIGSWPATWLPERFDTASRIALAPLLGFCVGTCVMTTLLQFAPTDDTDWVLVVLAVASALLAIRRRRRVGAPPAHRRWQRRDLVGLLVVLVAVVGPTDFVLHERQSAGPAAYYFTDVANYVAVQDAARTVSLHDARDRWLRHAKTGDRFTDQAQLTWSFFADFGSNLDAGPLDSNLNALLGLGATATFAPFLLALVAMGALGAFAAVRYLTDRRTWAGVLTGALFGGALFLELWFDSFQAALIAIGMIPPFLVLADSAIRHRRAVDFGLVALLTATMLTVYPLYILPLAIFAALLVGIRLRARRRRREPFRPVLAPLALTCLGTGALALVLDPVAVARDVHYYQLVLRNEVPFPRVGFHLPVSVLPGWIAQTREFWNMPPLGTGGFKQLMLALLLPLAFAAVAVLGVRRHRSSAMVVVVAVVYAVLAEYAYVSQQSCTYCGERNLLPLAPLAAVLIGVGVCALVTTGRRWGLFAGLVVSAVIVVAVGQRARVELIRFADSGYFMTAREAALPSRVPDHHASVYEEGFEASVAAQAAQPLMYHLLNEHFPGHVSILLGSDLGNALQYVNFGSVLPPGPEFDPNYRYVLTRLGAVSTDRRVIARSGSVALEERVAPLDITPSAGLSLSMERLPGSGQAWVQTQYPLQFYVVGTDGHRRAWAKLTFQSTVPVSIKRQRGMRMLASGHRLTVCVPATGRAPTRTVRLQVVASLFPGPPPHELFPPAMPAEGVALTGMQAVAGSCDP
jgi:hypothetical protein